MKKNHKMNTKNFPKDAMRVRKADGTRVWIYKGQEFKSKKDLINFHKLA